MIIKHPEYTHWLEVDDTSGLPTCIGHGATNTRVELVDFALTLTVGGLEVRSATGGLDYEGERAITGAVIDGTPCWASDRDGDRCGLPIRIGGVAASIEYAFRRHGPGLTLRIVLLGDQTSDLLVRDLSVRTGFRVPEGAWTLNAPGNGLARDVPLGEVSDWTGISPIGGLRGSSAVIHLGHPTSAIALWLRHELEVSDIRIKSDRISALSMEFATNFAGDLGRISRAAIDLFDIDLSAPPFQDFPEYFQTWLRLSGHTAPINPPAWIGAASIFEAQVGFSVFWPDHRYAPYPDVAALTSDLERIARLGFKVIQLMPRQPYPSYNVHDYWDIATSFGDPEQIRTLVTECHARGIRIILDVLLHGVLDQESITAAADGVRAGPYADLVTSKTTDSFSTDVGDWGNYQIAWSRHIIDFEPYWKAGSPAVSPLIAEHPDWFYRDSSGQVAGIYTKAFDARNPEWQAYFIDAMKYLLSELDVDGFRFDAPTYNDFPNWAEWARHRASLSTLGCIPLFERLRPALKAIKRDALMYTEPSGMLLRRSMDLNYNYDEQWLVTAVSIPSETRPWGVKNARGLARWVEDRDAFLPRGSMTAHHIDSHDTFWWPSWGSKWRREQFSIRQVQLLTLMFMSLPGPFMMFVGGEEGIEDLLESLNHLKNRPGWADLKVRWLNGDEIPESVFGVVRHDEGREIVSLVNLGDDIETISVKPGKNAPFDALQLHLTVGEPSPKTELSADDLQVELAPRSGIILEF